MLKTKLNKEAFLESIPRNIDVFDEPYHDVLLENWLNVK